jgi:kumamolisin
VYGFDATSARGQGATIGVVCGAGFKRIDVQSFWRSHGIVRSDPTLIETMEPLSTRFTETTLDIEWSGALAPAAQLLVFAGPDAYETSLVYTFNAAIEDGRAQVITDSFSRRCYTARDPQPVSRVGTHGGRTRHHGDRSIG